MSESEVYVRKRKLYKDEDAGFLCAGECAHYMIEHHRLVNLDRQIGKLSKFIIAEIPGEPSEDEEVIDTAIRWMRARLPVRADDTCQCHACLFLFISRGRKHDSDCSVHNEPALNRSDCDCL